MQCLQWDWYLIKPKLTLLKLSYICRWYDIFCFSDPPTKMCGRDGFWGEFPGESSHPKEHYQRERAQLPPSQHATQQTTTKRRWKGEGRGGGRRFLALRGRSSKEESSHRPELGSFWFRYYTSKEVRKEGTTTQSMTNAKLSLHGFWHCHSNGLIKTIQTIPYNL